MLGYKGVSFRVSFTPSLCATSDTSPGGVLRPPAGALKRRHLGEGEGLEVAEECDGRLLGQELHRTTRYQSPTAERKTQIVGDTLLLHTNVEAAEKRVFCGRG